MRTTLTSILPWARAHMLPLVALAASLTLTGLALLEALLLSIDKSVSRISAGERRSFLRRLILVFGTTSILLIRHLSRT